MITDSTRMQLKIWRSNEHRIEGLIDGANHSDTSASHFANASFLVFTLPACLLVLIKRVRALDFIQFSRLWSYVTEQLIDWNRQLVTLI